ncbi:ankyrin [Astrocystis sublimbata]|nr:ankyrin [Astrocystis sublimbata]
MPFSSIPDELSHYILAAAVRQRDLKRAVRLRLVSRAWNVAVEYAVFDSGILDRTGTLRSACSRGGVLDFWHRYLTYRALSKPKQRSRRLMMIRQVAECIVDLRGERIDDAQAGHHMVQCVDKICHAAILFHAQGDLPENCLVAEKNPMGRFDWNCDCFKQALLVAAACTNDLDLVLQLKSKSPHSHITTDTVDAPREPDSGVLLHAPKFPFDEFWVAAYMGNTQVISALLEYEARLPIEDMLHRESRGAVISGAAWGNQMETLDLVLSPGFDDSSPDFQRFRRHIVTGLMLTTSVDIFKRLFKIVGLDLQHRHRPYSPDYRRRWLVRRFQGAARNGEVSLMEYLAEFGLSVNVEYPGEDCLISLAASKGRKDAVRWLLDRGASMDDSLQAAVSHGSFGITRLLLEHGAIHDDGVVQEAIIESVRTENEALFGLLISYGARLSMERFAKAMQIAETEQLESMQRLLENTQTQRLITKALIDH